MADSEPSTIAIPLNLPTYEADAFAQLLKRTTGGGARGFFPPRRGPTTALDTPCGSRRRALLLMFTTAPTDLPLTRLSHQSLRSRMLGRKSRNEGPKWTFHGDHLFLRK